MQFTAPVQQTITRTHYTHVIIYKLQLPFKMKPIRINSVLLCDPSLGDAWQIWLLASAPKRCRCSVGVIDSLMSRLESRGAALALAVCLLVAAHQFSGLGILLAFIPRRCHSRLLRFSTWGSSISKLGSESVFIKLDVREPRCR